MGIVIQKFGGSSVATTEKLELVAEKIINEKKKGNQVVVVVSGADKADIVAKAFTGPVTPQVPASILQMHQDVTIVGDEAAFAKLK